MSIIQNRLWDGGQLATGSITTDKIAPSAVTGAKLSTAQRNKFFSYQVEDLAAGVDISAREIWQTVPFGATSDITRVEFHFEEATTGIDGSNSVLIRVSGPAGAVADTTLSGNVAAGATLVPTLTNQTGFAPGSNITLTVTQGTTANVGLLSVFIYYDQAD